MKRREREAKAPVSERMGAAATVWRVRATHAGLWALVVLGALGGLVGMFARGSSAAPKVAAPKQPSSLGAEGFAELYVASYLGDVGADTDDRVLRAFFPGDADLRGVQARALYVTQTVSLAAIQVSEGYWSVTVGARVLAAAEGAYQPLGLRAFQVGVVELPVGGYVATTLPAEVPLPPTIKLPRLAGEAPGTPERNEETVALSRFFSAFLAGQGELSRYVTPDSQIAAVSPSPYASTQVRRAGIDELASDPDDGRLARVEVAATDGGGRTQVLGYALELVRRDGLWQVRRLLPAPPLFDPATLPETAPSTTTGLRATTSSTPSTTSTSAPASRETTTTRRP